MISFKVKIDDKEMFKEIAGKKAAVEVGWFKNQFYEETDEPFYANVLRPQKMEIGYDFGKNKKQQKPRKFYKSEAKSIAQVAIQNEYGVPERNIPPRPFMKRTVDGNVRKWKKMVQDELPQMKKMDLRVMAIRLAGVMKKDIQRSIDELMFPPNAPSTVKMKGFNNPLIDTGTMRDTVTWKEVK